MSYIDLVLPSYLPPPSLLHDGVLRSIGMRVRRKRRRWPAMREKLGLDQPNENVSVREISLRGAEIGQKGAASRTLLARRML